MKFAVQKWVRTKEMKVTHIIKEVPTHPDYIKHYCDGCHAPLAGKPWAAVWAERGSDGKGGGYKLCQSCTEEARSEMLDEMPEESQ